MVIHWNSVPYKSAITWLTFSRLFGAFKNFFLETLLEFFKTEPRICHSCEFMLKNELLLPWQQWTALPYLLYLWRAMYHTTKPQANTNTTLAAKLAPTIVPRDNASFSPMGGTATKHKSKIIWQGTNAFRGAENYSENCVCTLYQTKSLWYPSQPKLGHGSKAPGLPRSRQMSHNRTLSFEERAAWHPKNGCKEGWEPACELVPVPLCTLFNPFPGYLLRNTWFE